MNAGEVWQVDIGLAGKVRPRLLLTGHPNDEEHDHSAHHCIARQSLGREHRQTLFER
jgi:hypothetical protein